MISNSSERNYGIDLLKIVSMFMVVVLHILRHGGIIENVPLLSVNDTGVWLIETLCLCAVNLFALTTGYLCVNKKFKLKNVINLWIWVVFYNVLFTVLIRGVDVIPFITSFFPVSNSAYWYFSAYFGFILFVPFINKYLNSIDKKEYTKLIVLILFITCGIGMLTNILGNDVIKIGRGYSSIWLLCLYIIGGYVKLFDFKFKNRSKTLYFMIYICSSLIALLSRTIILKFPVLTEYFDRNILLEYNSITIVINAFVLFLMFLKINIFDKFKKIVSFLSSISFSVYLIHFQKSMRTIMIDNLYTHFMYMPVYQMVFMILFTAVVIYVVCTIIDIFRYYLFKFLRVEKLSDWLDKKIVLMLTKKG